MISTIHDTKDGIILQFDMEGGMAIGIQQSDEAAQQLVNIIQNKLNARLKNPNATRMKTFLLREGENYDGDEEVLHWIEEEVFDHKSGGEFPIVKKNTKITVIIDEC